MQLMIFLFVVVLLWMLFYALVGIAIGVAVGAVIVWAVLAAAVRGRPAAIAAVGIGGVVAALSVTNGGGDDGGTTGFTFPPTTGIGVVLTNVPEWSMPPVPTTTTAVAGPTVARLGYGTRLGFADMKQETMVLAGREEEVLVARLVCGPSRNEATVALNGEYLTFGVTFAVHPEYFEENGDAAVAFVIRTDGLERRRRVLDRDDPVAERIEIQVAQIDRLTVEVGIEPPCRSGRDSYHGILASPLVSSG